MRLLRTTALTALLLLAVSPAWSGQVTLTDRNWRFGLQSVSVRQSEFAVFARAGLPPGPVTEKGNGGGFQLGRRFGRRFVLDIQVWASQHDIPDHQDELTGAWALLSGTVLFREADQVQPFLRGGIGGGGWGISRSGDQNTLFSFGTAAATGGGVMIRLSSRFTLDVDAALTFINHLEVDNQDGAAPGELDSWQVRVSSYSWRLGTGISIWF